MAFNLMDKGMIDFIGSDIHNMNQLNGLKEIQLNIKIINALKPIIRATTLSF